MKRQTEFWLSRDNERYASYELWYKKPNGGLCGYGFDGRLSPLETFCPEQWEQFMPALRLKPGQCRKVVICEAELGGLDGMFIGFAKEKK
jgi:hypothetical protein